MYRKHRFPVLFFLFCVNCAALHNSEFGLLDPKQIHVEMNQNLVGGELVLEKGNKRLVLFPFEKSIEYCVSPDHTRVAVTDTQGTAFFSVFIIDSDLKNIGLDDEIHRLKPELFHYSAVYPVAKRWLSNDLLLVVGEAYGPYYHDVPEAIKFRLKVRVPR